jgi:endonuclease/exonuclease/phosphatase (EEP) superfamily protein YafD
VRIIRFLLATSVWIAFAAVLADLALLRWVGESHWLTTVDLYLPHGLLLVPLALLALAVLAFGPRRLLLILAVAVLVVLFPIMGLRLGGPATSFGAPHLRLLTYNVDNGRHSVGEIVKQVQAAAPDVVLFQESEPALNDAIAAALPGFNTRASTQFFIASRYPIIDLVEPPKIPHLGAQRSPRFVRYTLDTPLGRLAVFSVHPLSPRDGFETIRGAGLKGEIESGRVFNGDHRTLTDNTILRRLQVEAIVEAARGTELPVLIAGDTNLPGGSGILADLGGYQDAFAEVGSGFGYTFPAHRLIPWMRIDRIFAGSGLRFTRAEVGTLHGSDHFCLYADVEKAP